MHTSVPRGVNIVLLILPRDGSLFNLAVLEFVPVFTSVRVTASSELPRTHR